MPGRRLPPRDWLFGVLLLGLHVFASSMFGLLYVMEMGVEVAAVWTGDVAASVAFVLGTLLADLLIVWLMASDQHRSLAGLMLVAFTAHALVYLLAVMLLFGSVLEPSGLSPFFLASIAVLWGLPGLVVAAVGVPLGARLWLTGRLGSESGPTRVEHPARQG